MVSEETAGLSHGYERPVMVHRAILGSVERMSAILTEHFGGKWPLWLSPRQVMVLPVSHKFDEYADYVARVLLMAGIEAEADTGNETLNKRVMMAQKNQYNYIAVVGGKEMVDQTVTLRRRDAGKADGAISVVDVIAKLRAELAVNSYDRSSTPLPFAQPQPTA